MGRPKSAVEIKQLSLKLPLDLYQRLLETAYHADNAKRPTFPSDVNLSEWIRRELANFVDEYAAENGGPAALQASFREARAAELREALANLEVD